MKRFLTLSIVVLLVTLTSVASRTTVSETNIQNVMIIIWDGTQQAHLLNMLFAGKLPNLKNLFDETQILSLPFINSETCEPGSGDGYMTQTGPANSAIATGLGFPGMANWTNKEPHSIPDGLTLWELFKGKGYVVGIVSSKKARFWPRGPLNNARPEIDYWQVEHKDQWWVTWKTKVFIQTHAAKPFFLWVHYREPDEVAHEKGENSPEYSWNLEVNDENLGLLLDELKTLEIKDQTLVLVTTDHGFDEGGFNHASCTPHTKNLFLITNGNGIGLLNCIETQTDITPCLKNLFQSGQ